ncbi:MAG TPA: glycosyltransferase family 1 protein [Bryobacteraceae bacterium]|nr:glycosyltransferase family 1 protein [Bryobacteraceae bacterium]
MRTLAPPVMVDATPLLQRSGGVKNYVFYWLQHLQRSAGSIRMYPFLRELEELDHERSIEGTLGTLVRLAFAHFANVDHNRVLNLVARRVELFHVSSNQVYNPPTNTKLSATVYDMTCWLVPGMHEADTVAWAKRFADRVLQRADGVIAISESTRRDVIEILGLPPERVTVIYPGIPEAFFTVTASQVDGVRTHYDLRREYILFVGVMEPRKNLPRLVEAYQSLAPSLREEFELILAGPIGWIEPQELAKILAPGTGIRHLGYVPEKDMAPLTAGATVMAYPSLYEGFGFPVAQAMAAGVPVVTSGISSLPELVGDAGELVDPNSVTEIRDALARVLTSPTSRCSMAQKGRERAREFSWDRCTRMSLEYFETLLGRS